MKQQTIFRGLGEDLGLAGLGRPLLGGFIGFLLHGGVFCCAQGMHFGDAFRARTR
jgi:hypothetical protein